MSADQLRLMKLAMDEAERARGSTGDNPWVGSVIADAEGRIVARGHTQGPGEDHAEIGALREAVAKGVVLSEATLYSTLEPCSFHGRTPACSRVIVDHRPKLVVVGMRDPHPRVDGEGIRIMRAAGVDVVEGILEAEIRMQLGRWVFEHHLHEPVRRAMALLDAHGPTSVVAEIAAIYAVGEEAAERAVREAESHRAARS